MACSALYPSFSTTQLPRHLPKVVVATSKSSKLGKAAASASAIYQRIIYDIGDSSTVLSDHKIQTPRQKSLKTQKQGHVSDEKWDKRD